jgi:hypothetical protein
LFFAGGAADKVLLVAVPMLKTGMRRNVTEGPSLFSTWLKREGDKVFPNPVPRLAHKGHIVNTRRPWPSELFPPLAAGLERRSGLREFRHFHDREVRHERPVFLAAQRRNVQTIVKFADAVPGMFNAYKYGGRSRIKGLDLAQAYIECLGVFDDRLRQCHGFVFRAA